MFARLYNNKKPGNAQEDREDQKGQLQGRPSSLEAQSQSQSQVVPPPVKVQVPPPTATKKKKKTRPPKKRKNDNSNSNDPSSTSTEKKQRRNSGKNPKSFPYPSEKALALSSQLKALSTQKRLNEALELYWHESNDGIRDEYHACILIDCCGRCGNIAEGENIVHKLKLQHYKKRQQKGGDSVGAGTGDDSFILNVQTKTALLKGYVHSGMIQKAFLLYRQMMDMETTVGSERESQLKSKSKSNGHNNNNGPNVRTLNTLLRGCLWSAATTYAKENVTKGSKSKINYEVHGGVITSEQIWPLSSPSASSSSSGRKRKLGTSSGRSGSELVPDHSSFEYSIILLSQALRVKEAEARINLFQRRFGITMTSRSRKKKGNDINISDNNENDDGREKQQHSYSFTAEDPTALETLVVSYISLTRACALLGKNTQAESCASKVLSLTSSMLSNRNQHQNNNDSTSDILCNENSNKDACTATNITSKIQIEGGKRAWKQPRHGHGVDNHRRHHHPAQEQQSRRVVSNKLFRVHRIKEIQSEAKMILNVIEKRHKSSSTNNNKKNTTTSTVGIDLPFYLFTRLLYFGGGGTTDLSALSSANRIKGGEKAGDNDNGNNSFGNQKNNDLELNDQVMLLNSLWSSFGLAEATREAYTTTNTNCVLPNSSTGRALTKGDHDKISNILGVKDISVLHSDGSINFSTVFLTKKEIRKSKPKPIYLELGSGFGEWAVCQARNNPSCDYVAVELRSDRVSQIFAKSILNESGTPLDNLCCIGSECGKLLTDRIREASISKIFINHPEPPTQTFGANSSVITSIANGGDEPAHMLNSQTIISAIKCLDGVSGELVIVTDNFWYAKLLCSTLLKAMSSLSKGENENVRLYNNHFDGDGQVGIRRVEEFHQGQSKVFLYEGKPNEAIGHFTDKNEGQQSGSSYFDRLWRSGAGTHAETEKRFIISMSRSFINIERRRLTSKKDGFSSTLSKKKKGSKKAKKRSAEKQKIRNARRLKKKQKSDL